MEQYASATGIVRMAKEKLAAEKRPTVLNVIEPLTARDIFDAAKGGGAAALELVDRLREILAIAMADISNVADPEVYVTGGVSRAGAILVDGIRRHFLERAFHACEDTEIVLAALGNDAGIYGCMRLLFDL